MNGGRAATQENRFLRRTQRQHRRAGTELWCHDGSSTSRAPQHPSLPPRSCRGWAPFFHYLALGPPRIPNSSVPTISPFRTGPRPLGTVGSSSAAWAAGPFGAPLERALAPPLPFAMLLECRSLTCDRLTDVRNRQRDVSGHASDKTPHGTHTARGVSVRERGQGPFSAPHVILELLVLFLDELVVRRKLLAMGLQPARRKKARNVKKTQCSVVAYQPGRQCWNNGCRRPTSSSRLVCRL